MSNNTIQSRNYTSLVVDSPKSEPNSASSLSRIARKILVGLALFFAFLATAAAALLLAPLLGAVIPTSILSIAYYTAPISWVTAQVLSLRANTPTDKKTIEPFTDTLKETRNPLWRKKERELDTQMLLSIPLKELLPTYRFLD